MRREGAIAPIAPLQAPDALPAYERGDFIGDFFQVIETLGEGGFGIVYLAESLSSNDIVALKTLRSELLRDAKTRGLFEKEARIWMDLGAHPNLVRAKWVDEIGGRLFGIAGLALVPGLPSSDSNLATASPSQEHDPSRTAAGTVFGTPTHSRRPRPIPSKSPR